MPQHQPVQPEGTVSVTSAEMQQAADEASLRKVARAVLAIARRQATEEATERTEGTDE